MIKKIYTTMCALTLLFVLCVNIGADKVYEFELTENEEKAEGVLSEFYENIPDEIKEELPEGRKNDIGVDFEQYSAEFFMEKILDAVKSAVSPATKTVTALLCIVTVAAVFNIFANTLAGESMKNTFSFCSSICIALSVYAAMQTVLSTVEALLKTLSETMLIMIPTMEAIYIQSGNLTSAAVTSTGINLMIGFTQTLFSKVLGPAVNTVFILCVLSSVTKNKGIEFMVKTLRSIITAAIMIVMTVMSFALALQSSGTVAADTFATRTVKFAIGNYLPIVGGTVAESFSLLAGSMSVIKQGSGIVGIAVIIIAFLPPFAIVLMNSFAVGLTGAAAGVLGCEREAALLSECKGICTMLLAVCAGAVMMYIIALAIFCKTPVAVG